MSGAPQTETGISQQHTTATKWILVATLAVMGMINYAVRTSISAVYPLLRTELGFTDAGLGVLGSLFLWTYGIASPFAGHVGDRFNRRRIVLLTLVGWSLVTAASGLVHTRWELMTMRVLLGLVESFFFPASMALVAQFHSPQTRGTALGFLSIGQYMGLILGTTFAGYLANHYGWRPSFWILGLAGLFIALPASALLPVDAPKTEGAETPLVHSANAPDFQFAEDFVQLFTMPLFQVLVGVGALSAFGLWILLNWLPLYFHESFGMSLAGAGFYGASFMNAGGAVSLVLGGMLSDSVARKGAHFRLLAQGVLMTAAAPLLIVFACKKSLLVIVAALTLNSAFRTASDVAIFPLLCEIAGKRRFSIAFGITNMGNCFSGALGILLAGLLKAKMGLAGIFAGVVGIQSVEAFLLFGSFLAFRRKSLPTPNME